MNINQKIDAQLRRELARITVSLLNDLVAAPLHQADVAAERAIRVVSDSGGFDRTYLFQSRDGALLDNTHEWVAARIAPMLDRLQGVPVSALGPWLDEFLNDRSVEVPHVPLMPADHPARDLLIE